MTDSSNECEGAAATGRAQSPEVALMARAFSLWLDGSYPAGLDPES